MLKAYVSYLLAKDAMARRLRSLVGNERGATAIEYGLIAAGIGVAISAVVILVGDALIALFNEVIAALG